jgi:hypothetical protein
MNGTKPSPSTRSAGAGLREGNGFMIWTDGRGGGGRGGRGAGGAHFLPPSTSPATTGTYCPLAQFNPKIMARCCRYTRTQCTHTAQCHISVGRPSCSPVYIRWGKYTPPPHPIITSLASKGPDISWQARVLTRTWFCMILHSQAEKFMLERKKLPMLFLRMSYLKVHKREIFYGSDFELCTFSKLFMLKY